MLVSKVREIVKITSGGVVFHSMISIATNEAALRAAAYLVLSKKNDAVRAGDAQ